jgi:hypothetical protein
MTPFWGFLLQDVLHVARLGDPLLAPQPPRPDHYAYEPPPPPSTPPPEACSDPTTTRPESPAPPPPPSFQTPPSLVGGTWALPRHIPLHPAQADPARTPGPPPDLPTVPEPSTSDAFRSSTPIRTSTWSSLPHSDPSQLPTPVEAPRPTAWDPLGSPSPPRQPVFDRWATPPAPGASRVLLRWQPAPPPGRSCDDVD